MWTKEDAITKLSSSSVSLRRWHIEDPWK